MFAATGGVSPGNPLTQKVMLSPLRWMSVIMTSPFFPLHQLSPGVESKVSEFVVLYGKNMPLMLCILVA